MGLQIVQIVASGTFGHVCVVREATTDRLFAAKVLRPSYGTNDKVVARLRDEAKVLARLDHPHIVGISEVREIAGQPVLLLEWVRGIPLDVVMTRTPEGYLPAADVLEVALTIVDALHAAYNARDPEDGHPLAVIHRDI
ncbi:MAG: protein kinase, partial [Myxococcota bacterium]